MASLKILYVAADQTVPGVTGGSVHVQAVAEGLAARGHEVHVLTTPGEGTVAGAAEWHPLSPPLGARCLRLLRAGQVTTYARRLGVDVVIERYYNFGGEGVTAARRTGALGVLEINAPVVDYPGSPKRLLDRALLIEPMRRWRDWQCRAADLFVTPLAATLPDWVPRDRIVEIEWGADVSRFRPDITGPTPFTRRNGQTVAVFAGAFRVWHGAIELVKAIASLRARGREDIVAVLIGDGPELERVKAAARGLAGVTFTGALPHEQMPACLAACDIGVAPFTPHAHAPLRLGFYWSPLKLFEYMAAGLPVAAPNLERLRALVRHEAEGLLYDPADADGLADALIAMSDPARRAALGAAARTRVVHEFSWAAHCEKLEAAMHERLTRIDRARAGS